MARPESGSELFLINCRVIDRKANIHTWQGLVLIATVAMMEVNANEIYLIIKMYR